MYEERNNTFSTEFTNDSNEDLPITCSVRILRLPTIFWAEHCDWTNGLNAYFLRMAKAENLFRSFYKGECSFKLEPLVSDLKEVAESYFDACCASSLYREQFNEVTMRGSDIVCFSPTQRDYDWQDSEENGGKTSEEWEDFFSIFQYTEEEKARELRDRAPWSAVMALPMGWTSMGGYFTWSQIEMIDRLPVEDIWENKSWCNPKLAEIYKQTKEKIENLTMDFEVNQAKLRIEQERDKEKCE